MAALYRHYQREVSDCAHVWLCAETDHYSSSEGDKGWGCGYRNFQMQLSSLHKMEQYNLLPGKKNYRRPMLFVLNVFVLVRVHYITFFFFFKLMILFSHHRGSSQHSKAASHNRGSMEPRCRSSGRFTLQQSATGDTGLDRSHRNICCFHLP